MKALMCKVNETTLSSLQKEMHETRMWLTSEYKLYTHIHIGESNVFSRENFKLYAEHSAERETVYYLFSN